MPDETQTTEQPDAAPVAEKSLIGSAPTDAKAAEAGPEQPTPKQPEAKEGAEPPAQAALFDPAAWKAPEGVKIDEEKLKGFAEVVNDQKLSGAERGAKLLSLYQEAMDGATKQVTDYNAKAWADTIGRWEKTVKADEEIGGDKLEPALQSIGRMLNVLGPEGSAAFKAAMTVTGAGSHPAVVKGMAKLAELLTEGNHIPGSPGGGKAKSIGSIFFPNSPEMKGDE